MNGSSPLSSRRRVEPFGVLHVGGNGTESSKILDGVVIEVRPKALFRVALDDGKTVLAGPGPRLRHAIVRLVVGDRVTVQLSRHDPNRGQIIAKT